MRDESGRQVRRLLLERIGRRYQVTTARVNLGGLEIEFTRIADPDRVLDQVAQEEDRREKVTGLRHRDDELHLPYWAELWDSATGIGQHLVRQVKSGTQRLGSVLDLGCGMGLSGAVAAALGARVMFADLERPALLFARLNSLPWRNRVRTRQLNWRTDRLGERFDLIIGADILYEKAQWPFLEVFWREHLADGGLVMLGEPGRQTGDLFMEWIAGRGWNMRRHDEPVSTRPGPVRVFLLRDGSKLHQQANGRGPG
jgi:predicted nicotinamide N-methyase